MFLLQSASVYVDWHTRVILKSQVTKDPRPTTFTFGGNTYQYSVVYSTRKTIVASVSANGVVVRANKRVSLKEIQWFVEAKAKTLVKHLNKFQIGKMEKKYLFQDGEVFWFCGKQYTLAIDEKSQNSVTVRGSDIIVSTLSAGAEVVRSILLDWYCKQAANLFREALSACLQRFEKLSPVAPVLIIKHFRSRLGHMTKSNVMALNVKLICASQEQLRCVIYHELVHTVYFNHGKQFHCMLESLCSDHRIVEKQIANFFNNICGDPFANPD